MFLLRLHYVMLCSCSAKEGAEHWSSRKTREHNSLWVLGDIVKQEGPEWFYVWCLEQAPLSHYTLFHSWGHLEQHIIILTVLCKWRDGMCACHTNGMWQRMFFFKIFKTLHSTWFVYRDETITKHLAESIVLNLNRPKANLNKILNAK